LAYLQLLRNALEKKLNSLQRKNFKNEFFLVFQNTELQ